VSDPYVGEIRMFGGTFAPAGWALCDGQTMPISENEVLFQLIGTTYGGDGEETFNLPNLQSRVPIHMGTGPDGTTYQLGEMAGVESVTLTVPQLPIHNHAFVADTNQGNVISPDGALPANSPNVQALLNSSPDGNMAAQAISPVGGSQPHENLQPFTTINFIISLFGIFPSQT
jgi:microcystin-dependent protein